MRPFRWPRRVRGWTCCVLFPLFPIVSLAARAENYNFNKNDGGWTSPGPAPNWVYGQLPANEKSWKAFCSGEAAASFLLSPCFRVDDKTIDVDFGHRFRFENNPVGKQPIGAGQVQYSLDDSGIWLGISTWSSQGNELPPTFTPSWPDTVPPLVAPGLAFVGTSPKYFNSPSGGGNFNDSSFQLSGLTPGGEISFRFVAAMFEPVCPECDDRFDAKSDDTFDAKQSEPCDSRITPLWDLNRFHIKGATEQPCVPEPAGLGLAAAGAAATLLLLRRRVSPRKIAGFVGEKSPMGQRRLPPQVAAANGWACRDGRESSSLARTPRRPFSEDELLGSSALSEAPAQRRPTWVIAETRSFTRPFLLRRQPRRRASGRSGCRHREPCLTEGLAVRLMMFGASLAAALVMIVSPLAAARAEDIETFNFNQSESGWYQDLADWTYSKVGGDEASWKLVSTGTAAVTAYLYSPCLTVTDPNGDVTFDFNNGHKFNFGLPAPPLDPNYLGGAGQVQYSLNDGLTWSAVPANQWSSQGTNIPPTFDPTLMTSPAPLLTSGLAFQGTSGGVNYIASAFTLPLGVGAIGNDIQFRMLGNIRIPSLVPSGIAWDIDKIQIKGVVQCPEPAGIALAATGLLLAGVGLHRRRLRSGRNAALAHQ